MRTVDAFNANKAWLCLAEKVKLNLGVSGKLLDSVLCSRRPYIFKGPVIAFR